MWGGQISLVWSARERFRRVLVGVIVNNNPRTRMWGGQISLAWSAPQTQTSGRINGEGGRAPGLSSHGRSARDGNR